MITVDNKPSISKIENSNGEELTAKIVRAFKEMEDLLVEELRESAELQAKSVASAMAMPSDSIY